MAAAHGAADGVAGEVGVDGVVHGAAGEADGAAHGEDGDTVEAMAVGMAVDMVKVSIS